ncbi:Serine/threonine-protein kinase HT1 [Vitis vinifera]|uniref:Serine/threonine-protein kinase HT1 n=1 Tax=Vitis vinifera TaxID=29760 RepID=A0A438IGM9_VITVI|nr:Serine/threonine-protein kinase HT1 [Vitis vinifera]
MIKQSSGRAILDKVFRSWRGRVTAVEAADEWMADLSKLYLGLRFSHGAHSRLYHGVYEEQPVAVKVIMVPDEEENGALASKLEKQFNGEVSVFHVSTIKMS